MIDTPITQFLGSIQQFSNSSLQRCGEYNSVADFVLKHGQHWRPQPLPEGYSVGRARECFSNAAKITLIDRRLTYVEGYAWSGGGVIPVEHAWCVDQDGNVIDPTWERKHDGEWMRGVEYFGVPFKREYLGRALVESKRYGLISAYWSGYPVLMLDPSIWKHPIISPYVYDAETQSKELEVA